MKMEDGAGGVGGQESMNSLLNAIRRVHEQEMDRGRRARVLTVEVRWFCRYGVGGFEGCVWWARGSGRRTPSPTHHAAFPPNPPKPQTNTKTNRIV